MAYSVDLRPNHKVVADFDCQHALGVLCRDSGYCTGPKHSEGMERFEISLDARTPPRVASRNCQGNWAILSSFNQKRYLLKC